MARQCTALGAATLCHVSSDITLPNWLANQLRSQTEHPMRLRTVIELAAALLLTFAALVAISQMARAGSLRIEEAYARATIGIAKTGAVYLSVVNDGSSPERLRGATTAVAEHAQLHLHAMKDDVMTMAQVKCLVIPAGGRITMAPGGLHIMLTGLASPLNQGQQFPLHLSFDAAGDTVIEVAVKGPGAGDASPPSDVELEFCD
jgi:periplasmic copper chaperone A